MNAPVTASDVELVSGPERIGSEQRWRVLMPDGTAAVLAQLLPELARDESIRRRYVRDVERVQALHVEGLARVVELGPAPDPRDTNANPPFRIRVAPEGRSLDAWLDERAPLPIDDACALVAGLADIVHRLHEHGAIVRDLHPRFMTIDDAGGVCLTDVGLARVEVLSTRTAASLVLEGSPYASPEQLARTTIDQRSDLYGLGVILFRALTGALPFGDEPALLRDPSARVPGPRELRSAVPEAIDTVARRLLATDPGQRPESAAETAAALRGELVPAETALDRVQCQSCGTSLRPGQHLCLSCGKLAVQFEHSQGHGYTLELRKAKEDATFLANLRGFLESVADGAVPPLNFLVGDARMYSKEEQKRRIRLPAALLTQLSEDSAFRIQQRLSEQGIATRIRPDQKLAHTKASRRGIAIAVTLTTVAVMAVIVTVSTAVVSTPVLAALPFIIVAGVIGGVVAYRRRRLKTETPLVRLRSAPAALPASDDLVRRLSGLLREKTPVDVREQVGELALLVQLIDHRVENAGERAEIDAVTEPVERLVELVVRQVKKIGRIDTDLAQLDEGTLVRSLAAAPARGTTPTERAEILDGLDKLRGLEDERAQAFHRLLEASALLRRSIRLGLAIHDQTREHDRQVALALAALERD